jgi:hypothetical protein
MKGNHSQANYALTVLADAEIRTVVTVTKLQAAAIDQLAAIPRIEREAALRAILCGLTLHRVKASLPHGQFGVWIDQMRPSGSHLPAVTRRHCQRYMRLAVAAIQKTKATVPEILALPGDQKELALESTDETARHLMQKLATWVGDRSLNEMLCDLGIKAAGKLGGAREKSDDDAPIDPEQLAAQAREELSAWHEMGRQLLLTDNVCSRLTPDEIRALDESLDAMLAQWRRGLKETLAKPA